MVSGNGQASGINQGAAEALQKSRDDKDPKPFSQTKHECRAKSYYQSEHPGRFSPRRFSCSPPGNSFDSISVQHSLPSMLYHLRAPTTVIAPWAIMRMDSHFWTVWFQKETMQ